MQQVLDWLGQLDVIAIIGAVAGVVGILGWLGIKEPRLRRRGAGSTEGTRPPDVDAIDFAARKLAGAVQDQWEGEAHRLGLLARPATAGAASTLSASVMQIGWSINAHPIGPADSSHEAPARWSSDPGVDELADFFRDVQPKALVVLGSAASGKSAAAILLTLGLLGHRQRDTDPVPVRFSLHQWDGRFKFSNWLRHRILDDHAGLRTAKAYGPDVVSDLLREHRVLPILDGLDELPEEAQDQVIDAINRVDPPLPGVVLTCQEGKYGQRGRLLTEAWIVRLAGVSAKEAERYILNSTGGLHLERWQPVLVSLTRKKRSALVAALSSPLMVYLVSKVYGDTRKAPADLLTYTDRAALEDHLLRGFLPAVFDGQPWRSDEAERWLGHIALSLEESADDPAGDPTIPFGWWELSRFGRPPTAIIAGVVGGVTAFAALFMSFTALFNVGAGLVAGTVAGLVLGALCLLNEPPKPSETQVQLKGRLASIARSGLAIGIIVFIGGTLARDPTFGLIAGIGFGVPIAFLYGLTEPDPTVRSVEPRALLRRDMLVGLTFGVGYGVPAGITGWGLTSDVLVGAAVGLTAGLAGALLYGPIWILAALAPGSRKAAKVRTVGVVAFVHLAIATAWFGSRGKLPWRVMAFLDHAHEVGALRMAGAGGRYEFRHDALRRILAAQVAPQVDAPAIQPAHPPPDVATPP